MNYKNIAAPSSLSELNIRPRDKRPGEHRCPCPRCAEAKARPRDTALALRLEADGHATWVCHRCSWKGSVALSGGP
jgi:hypothetical protein